MSYTAYITDTTTGEQREFYFDDLDWEEHSDYLWSDGNFGCDCNRSNWFRMAGGGPAAEFDECNQWPSPNRYWVTIKVDDKIIFDDFEE